MTKFMPGRYYSDDGHELTVCAITKTGLVRGFVGFALEGNYKPRIGSKGEYITAKGHTFYAGR